MLLVFHELIEHVFQFFSLIMIQTLRIMQSNEAMFAKKKIKKKNLRNLQAFCFHMFSISPLTCDVSNSPQSSRSCLNTLPTDSWASISKTSHHHLFQKEYQLPLKDVYQNIPWTSVWKKWNNIFLLSFDLHKRIKSRIFCFTILLDYILTKIMLGNQGLKLKIMHQIFRYNK